MYLSDKERALIMSGVEAKWRIYRKWGWSDFPYGEAHSLFLKLSVSISSEFFEAMREAGCVSE